MAYTKKRGSHAKVTIDGTDVSNAFRLFNYTSENEVEDASGFSAAGTREEIPGDQVQEFIGEAWASEELLAIIEPIQRARSTCAITYQPNGLVDATREVYTGATVYIHRIEDPEEFGAVSTFPFRATPAPGSTITVSNWT